ncbi:hypothetical protein EV44_g3928 [Erysiphe necator]|uniref:Uncharacterized protein n=1 Tax=Uncinula necator TaxID=52586 RepID=A0A0B1P1C3_UNCNE|nr:hypothetical protein EV44_g3928 [Erysiphe necator]
MNYRGTPYELHRNLSRAQSSIATQVRSEHIGLNSYLYRRKVPGVETPTYWCGYRSQNVKHMIMACPRWAKGRSEILRKAENRFFKAMINNPKGMARITQWILNEGKLEQFRLVGAIETVIKQRGEEKKLRQTWTPHWHVKANVLPKGKLDKK